MRARDQRESQLSVSWRASIENPKARVMRSSRGYNLEAILLRRCSAALGERPQLHSKCGEGLLLLLRQLLQFGQ